ncbi:glycosyl transferase [Croceivirga radicis]|uniref:Glycosyl transferase n=1 Tax=Croceivirga radicis TaxID=1929488 RepID=A0A1V6LSB6_9FLAO|nr:ATP-grasp fold amidoligase family protein [Croceivirga radicis]OQD43080.1 glycosyl transferase [Croceivirga radicis]
MIQPLEFIYKKTSLGRLLQKLYSYLIERVLPDNWVVKHLYKKKTKQKLDLKNPKTLNEKINWLKLYDRREIHTLCADKYEVRNYISSTIGSEFLVDLYHQDFSTDVINANSLSQRPCIIKTNHDSGGGIFIYKDTKPNYDKIREQLKKRLEQNYYHAKKEWQYKNIKPRIIIEKLLLNQKGEIPMDYKVHCFNGKAEYIQVDINRGTDNHARNWYNKNWEKAKFKWTSNINGYITNPTNKIIKRPMALEQMLALSNKLATPFPYVRIDWYDVDGKLYFGEITFHHDGGGRLIEPSEWDYKLGAMVDLNRLSIIS